MGLWKRLRHGWKESKETRVDRKHGDIRGSRAWVHEWTKSIETWVTGMHGGMCGWKHGDMVEWKAWWYGEAEA